MFLFATTQALAVMAAATTPVHSAEIQHGARALTASYHATPSVTMQQVEPRFANRNAIPVCRWQANLSVSRAVSANGHAVPAVGKSIHRFEPLSGSYAGTCAAAQSHIDAKVASYAAAKSGEAVTVAQQDRAALKAELDGLHMLTVQGG